MRRSRPLFGLSTAVVAWGAGLAAASPAQQPAHDCLVAEARRLPDLGGVYLSDDRLRVHVRVAGASAERREQVRASLSRSCNDTGVVVETSRYTLAQLTEWTTAANDVLSVDGVAFVGPDERSDSLVAGITKDGAEDEVRRVLAAKGVPADAVRIEHTSPIRTAEGGGPDGSAPADDGGGSDLTLPTLGAVAACAAALGGLLLRRRRPRPEPAS